MAKVDLHANGERSNGGAPISASSLVFCNVNAVAQAVTRSLGLTETVQLSLDRATSTGSDPWPGRRPDLAIVIDSNVHAIVAAVRGIKRRWKPIRVLVVGLHGTQAAIVSCVEAGADGLFMADEPLEQLSRAVQDLLAGKFRPPPNLLKIWAEESKTPPRPRADERKRAANVLPLPSAPVPSAPVRPDLPSPPKDSPWAGAGAARPLGRKFTGR